MQIERIDSSEIQSLEFFLDSCGSALETFRYFSSRPLSVIKTHLATLLGFDERRVPMAYGHLDQEDGVVWLGICVADGHQGKGYGKAMMRALLDAAHSMNLESISLTVDATNPHAARLYEKFGFKRKKQSKNVCWYRLDLSEKQA